jgi:Prp8 binding protein|eukprot:Transcript_21024.p1 GENE.Transcript_21024~~Transcript_21024.p1  ORF type:complete len:356 (-),score=151.18 Transcript_21024:147-1214(-)
MSEEPGKRDAPSGEEGGALVEAKKQRTELVTTTAKGGGAIQVAGPQRTSDLLAPIMLLTGHAGPVLSSKFSPDGRHLVSGSHDKMLLLWEVFGECKNTLTFKGHQNAVLEVHWSADGESIFSASADKTVLLWDVHSAARVRGYKGHMGLVNSCCPSGAHVMASASDDCTVRLWDDRVRTCQRVIRHPYPVTAVSVGQAGTQLFTGCLDGHIRAYDLRRPEGVSMVLQGHQDIVSGMRLSPDGNFLLSNAMDNTLRCWDVKPYAAGDRCVKVFLGAQHSYERGLIKCNWSASGTQVTCGSADNFVYVWDVASKRILYKLPGHSGSVNEVDFHPTQPIIGSCANDKSIYLGEIRGTN